MSTIGRIPFIVVFPKSGNAISYSTNLIGFVDKWDDLSIMSEMVRLNVLTKENLSAKLANGRMAMENRLLIGNLFQIQYGDKFSIIQAIRLPKSDFEQVMRLGTSYNDFIYSNLEEIFDDEIGNGHIIAQYPDTNMTISRIYKNPINAISLVSHTKGADIICQTRCPAHISTVDNSVDITVDISMSATKIAIGKQYALVAVGVEPFIKGSLHFEKFECDKRLFVTQVEAFETSSHITNLWDVSAVYIDLIAAKNARITRTTFKAKFTDK